MELHWNLEIVRNFPLLGLYRERVFTRNSPPRYSLRPFKSDREWASRPWLTSQVGFAEFNNTADNRANIGGTIIGAPIVGQ